MYILYIKVERTSLTQHLQTDKPITDKKYKPFLTLYLTQS